MLQCSTARVEQLRLWHRGLKHIVANTFNAALDWCVPGQCLFLLMLVLLCSLDLRMLAVLFARRQVEMLLTMEKAAAASTLQFHAKVHSFFVWFCVDVHDYCVL